MAKALIGYLDSDLRTPARLSVENHRLRQRVTDLEALVSRLQDENDRLAEISAQVLLDDEAVEQELLPA